MNTGTWLGTDVLMFIGGGSAGTTGDIKITTFTVLLFVIHSEIRGDDSTTAFGRRIPVSAQRQALSVALLAVAAVGDARRQAMFVGRTGTNTLATALALRHRDRLYRLPEERPIIG